MRHKKYYKFSKSLAISNGMLSHQFSYQSQMEQSIEEAIGYGGFNLMFEVLRKNSNPTLYNTSHNLVLALDFCHCWVASQITCP